MDTPRDARPILVIEHESDAGLARLERSLIDAAGAIEVRRPYLGDPLPERAADGYRALLVLGGAMAAWEDDVAPWLPQTRRLLADAVRADLPTLGICLGGQLLALACGGSVERGADGLEVGIQPIHVLDAAWQDEFLGGALHRLSNGSQQTELTVPQYHQDAVTRLPDDAILLATGERYPYQAFRVGSRAWGLQYHPEVSDVDFAFWVNSSVPALTAGGHDPERLLTQVGAASEELQRVADSHGASFAAASLAAH